MKKCGTNEALYMLSGSTDVIVLLSGKCLLSVIITVFPDIGSLAKVFFTFHF